MVYLLDTVMTFFSTIFVFCFFITNILYYQLNYNGDAWYILWVKLHGIVREVCFSMVRYVLDVV